MMYSIDEFIEHIECAIKFYMKRAPRTTQEIAAYIEGLEDGLDSAMASENDAFNFSAAAYVVLQRYAPDYKTEVK